MQPCNIHLLYYINRGKVNDLNDRILVVLKASTGKLFQRVMELGTKEDWKVVVHAYGHWREWGEICLPLPTAGTKIFGGKSNKPLIILNKVQILRWARRFARLDSFEMSNRAWYPRSHFLSQIFKANFCTLSRSLMFFYKCGSHTWAAYSRWGLTNASPCFLL